ncbi:MAG TPA: YtxH domain-containing protein [Gemmatimonadaceae bacterium]|nr:YtxH domain-containing protein [Gemmatimonadaceae bacterium]
MSRHEFDDEPYVVIERQSAGVAPFLMGLALGAAAALLLAPRSGAATRRDIKRRALRVRRAAEHVASDVTDTVVDTFQDARRRVEEQIDTARHAVEVKRRQVHRAMEAGRLAAHEAREELEQRIAETKAAYNAGAAVARDGRTGVAADESGSDEG